MRENLFVRLVLVASVLALPGRAATPPSVDECIKNLRTGPDSFVAYLCLGTPGLPERPAEVRKALEGVLRRTPGEPHARLYLGLMDVYALKDVDKREFTEPLALLEKRQLWVDVFLGQLAFLERICIRGREATAECRAQRPLVDRAEQFARQSGDPSLVRLVTIVRMRWSAEVISLSDGRRAEKALDAMAGEPPEWLRLLEVSTRASFASAMGDTPKIRQLYMELLGKTVPGSTGHTAALAGVAGATAQLALEGLADRDEAERLLRAALEAQEALKLVDYNGSEVGAESTRYLLAMLLGRTPETVAWGARERWDGPLEVELLLGGNEQERQRALELAHRRLEHSPASNGYNLFSVAHAEFAVGSAAEGIRWGDRSIEALETRREGEDDDTTRIRVDASRGIIYQSYISDLLEADSANPIHLAKAWEVLERLRSRVLLNKLLTREGGTHSPVSGLASIHDVQSTLREGEALVSFFVWAPHPLTYSPYTRGHSYALVVTRSALRAVPIPTGAELEPAVKAWTGMLEDRNATLERGSRRLYAVLIKPVLDILPPDVHELVLVPDGPLHRLPFDALSETGGPPYLADRYELSVVPSASVWTRLRARSPLNPGLALAFANTPEGPAVAVAETRGEVVPGQLAALLHAREEAEEAVNAFPSGSKLFVGADATPERLLARELQRASLVHFAAHGVTNEREPDESFLLLAPTANGSGVLKVADVPRFDWTGKTVVLSACDTSVGALHLGEGVLSLARGFFAGGASAVIGTLSRVRDDDQRTLFHAFYAELRKGVSVGEAMTAAKRALIRSGAPPAAWANVIVLGDATVRPRAADSFWTSQAFLSGSAAGLVLLVLGLRTRRRKAGASSE